jgi:putative PIN family toxin of toxin-antitoxin system
VKVVLDTNVLISGIFFSGPPSEILVAWSEGRFDVVVSLEIIHEYRRVVDELQVKFPKIDAAPVLDAFIVGAAVCVAKKFDEPLCDDPNDDMFVECAIAADAGVIVTGDAALLRLSGHDGISIVRPRDFVDQYVGK